MRQRLRLVGVIWLGWTIAGLFYIVQDAVPRLYRDSAVPWKNLRRIAQLWSIAHGQYVINANPATPSVGTCLRRANSQSPCEPVLI
jgi:hypothetical protein